MTATATTATALAALFAAIGLNACVISGDGDSSLTIDNRSDYAIYQAYLAEVNEPTWGPELLQGDILYPNESLFIDSIRCGTYDVLIYDQIGAECELNFVDLCFDDARWVITNGTLSTCPIFR